MEENFFCKKEELFTFYELEIIKNSLSLFEKSCKENSETPALSANPLTEVLQKITAAQKIVESAKNSMTVFFMPEENFKIFSLFNLSGNSSSINKADAEKMLCAVEKLCENQKIKNHLEKKLKSLCALLSVQNEAFCCALKTDGLLTEL